jgi:hypothetical protein
MHGGTNEGQALGSLAKAAKNGYQTVLSNGFYIDLMLGVESIMNDQFPKVPFLLKKRLEFRRGSNVERTCCH